MPTRRTKQRTSTHSGGPETPERMLDRVLGAFDRWLSTNEPNPDERPEIADIVRTACELKASMLGEPNPADWDAQVAVEVIGRVIPRKVVGVDQQYAEALVPGMLTFIDFLTETGRWKPHNDAAATRAALEALGPELPKRFEDPGRLSMGGRIIQLAIQEGVDVSDPDALAGFTQRFNDMPFEWRKRLTDGPGGPDPALFGDGPIDVDGPWDDEDHEGLIDSHAVLDELQAAVVNGAESVGFTGETLVITVPDAETELTALLDTLLLTRMSALLEWVRPGQQVTSTGAMRRADTAEWARRFGVVMPNGSLPNSMWDLPELAVPWSVAAGLGLIDIATTKVYPGEDNDVFATGDTPTRLGYARDAVRLVLHDLLGPGDELSELNQAATGLLLPVLACLCRPQGADLSPLRALADPEAASTPMSLSDMVTGILFSTVINIVDMLREWGLVSTAGTKVSVPPALRPAVVKAIHAPDAPFSFRLERGAVPPVT